MYGVLVNALKKEDDTFATSDIDKAEISNRYFSSVFTNENIEDIPNVTENIHSRGITITDLIITPKAAEEKLNALNVSKAQGPDGVPPRIYKELSKEVSLPLATLFNKPIETNTIPDV